MPAREAAHGLDPGMEASYATLGQLSYVPTTHTTVVTTTTTTKIDFPPILLRAPRSLVERDPKIYPLACSPAPESVRRFAFDAGGTQAYFNEADDVQQSLNEYNTRHDALIAANGRVESVQHYNAQYETPNRTTQSSGITGRTLTDPLTRSFSGRRKRSSSPPSIAEAAELASLQRKSKKSRATILGCQDAEGTVPATPDTDAGTSGRFKIPKIKGGSRRSNLRSSNQGEKARQSPANQTRNLTTANSGEGATPIHESRFHAAVLDGPGISATPPIAETDMEPVTSFSSGDVPFARPARPAPLDTVLTQDASLPSPSLSPITAAANLAHNANHNSLRGGDGQEEDPYEVSILDISEDRSDQASGLTKLQTRSASRMQHIDLPDRLDGASPNPQLPTPTVMGIPAMLDSFDSMPEQMKTYVMFHLLRRCTKPTLHFVADVVNPALKCDFLGLLPLELGLNVLKYLDVKSMCNAAQVSRKWRHIVDTDETAWKDLLAKDGYELPDGDLERAVKEGWGWQYPHSSESYERDLRVNAYAAKSDGESPGSSGSSTVGSYADSEGPASTKAISARPKRKASSLKLGNSKKQRRKGPTTSKAQAPSWSRSLGNAHGPIAIANVAISAVPNPNIGLPSLRSLHLFKSLYTRHHLIRKSWMEEETRPKHIAFRAHQRHVVTCLQFDTDKILTGSDDTNINVYDTKSGALRSHLEGHEGGVWALQYEGNTLVSGSTDRSVRVWDIEKGKCTHVFQGHTSTVRCLVILKPTPTGEIVDGQSVMMPREPLIITGSRDSSLRVWKLPQPGERSIIQTGPPANDHDNQYFIRALTGHHHSVRAIAAHGDTLISGSYDCTVRVWKISTGETVHRLQGHAQKVYSVVLDHARKRCISGSMDNMVKVWSLETGQCLFNLEGHTSLVGLLDLSHERLVSAAADSTLRIWDPENGQCKSTLSAHTGAITCFQHDGQKVISGSDRTLKMWNVKTGECVKDLLTDLSGVWQVKFNERRCVAAVQRNNMTYIEVLDFGASRDGVPADQRGRRIVVDSKGREVEDLDDSRTRGTEDIEEVIDADAP
ncbi:WD repeat-containing protein pop1 [Mytilinidion resinicola]|uniref:WD repeat-containing protein pop1 n=1 Tax=Mytilinidion resinicola TaxID=574789 RepID=A0A6A6YVI9_9PEZI|nr:WD repeat-containing protein pop1 [Mytilinidion resinicola]KAF2812568.1 WD repeat-containing protein pop1 [Mytilinidion resinicola]